MPDFIDENIFYLGQSYAFFWKNLNFDPLFNGNNISNNHEFDLYLKRLGYSFKNENYEFSNYVSLRNKKINLIMDIGPSPNKKFSNKYQAGALSFEFVSNGKKIKFLTTDLSTAEAEGEIFYSNTDNGFKVAVATAAWSSGPDLSNALGTTAGSGKRPGKSGRRSVRGRQRQRFPGRQQFGQLR